MQNDLLAQLKDCATNTPQKMESQLKKLGFPRIAGVDEAGRGPLAGPVVVCACSLPQRIQLPRLNDSKKLSEKQRNELFSCLTDHPQVRYSISVVDHEAIDRFNILEATMQGALTALKNILESVDVALMDGPIAPKGVDIPVFPVIKGDAFCRCISAASVIAKVTRDRLMCEYDRLWPEYGFHIHKGYGTKLHVERLKQYGPCPIHRKTFAPVSQLCKEILCS